MLLGCSLLDCNFTSAVIMPSKALFFLKSKEKDLRMLMPRKSSVEVIGGYRWRVGRDLLRLLRGVTRCVLVRIL